VLSATYPVENFQKNEILILRPRNSPYIRRIFAAPHVEPCRAGTGFFWMMLSEFAHSAEPLSAKSQL
jgi:hypothetical protein